MAFIASENLFTLLNRPIHIAQLCVGYQNADIYWPTVWQVYLFQTPAHFYQISFCEKLSVKKDN